MLKEDVNAIYNRKKWIRYCAVGFRDYPTLTTDSDVIGLFHILYTDF